MQVKTITLKGVIDKESYEKFACSIAWIKKENTKTVFIHILSVGGSMQYAYKIAELIQSIDDGVSVIFVAHYVHSAALVVFISRGLRVARKKATFLFHNPTVEEGSSVAQIDLQNTKVGFISYFVSKTEVLKSKVIELLTANTYISAEQALQIGLVHEIIPDTL